MIRGDVTDPAAVERTVADCGVVYHLARARAHGGLPMRVVDSVNIGGAGTITEGASRAGVAATRARQQSRGLWCAAAHAAGDRGRATHVDSAYARSKLRAEQEARSRAGRQLSIAIARITIVLGPGSLGLAQFDPLDFDTATASHRAGRQLASSSRCRRYRRWPRALRHGAGSGSLCLQSRGA